MPSAAAIEGIRVHGLKWRHQIKLHDLTSRIGRLRDELEGPAQAAELTRLLREIGQRTTAFIALPRCRELREPADAEITDALDFLAECDAASEIEVTDESFLEEMDGALNDLFDFFDFYRIVVL